MADTKISALTDGTTANATDRIAVARDPTGTPLSRYITPAYINTYLIALSNTWTGVNVFSPSGDLIEQYRSTSPQTYQIYNTRTDASNYERGFVRWVSNELRIGTEKAGTGSARDVYFYRDGSLRMRIEGSTISLNSAGMNVNNNVLEGHTHRINARTTSASESSSGSVVTNAGATGTITRTLAGTYVTNIVFRRVASHALRIAPPTGVAFRRSNGTLETINKYLELGSDGATVWLTYDGTAVACLFETGTVTIEP